MKKLAKKLEENSTASRCPAFADCMERVKKNKRPTAFIHVKKNYLNALSIFLKIIFCIFHSKMDQSHWE